MDTNRIIEMAWEDRTPFEAIKMQFDVSEAEVIKLMRTELKRSSFNLWRKRVNSGVSQKHAKKRSLDIDRFKCTRQRAISLNKNQQTMTISVNELGDLEQRYRVTLINSLAGFKQAVLIGTKSSAGTTNLAIFNSLIHLGSNPALYGFICRPDTVQRDTLSNILETGEYTLNYVSTADFEKAHQTSARYESGTSEFAAVGFTEQFSDLFNAPFVQEAVVKIAMKFEDQLLIPLNGTLLIIGSIQQIEVDKHILNDDGFVDLSQANVLACAGLDAYYSTRPLGRLLYAKPGKWPVLR